MEPLTTGRAVLASVSSPTRLDGDPVRPVDPAVDATIRWLDVEHAILLEEPGPNPSQEAAGRLWIGPVRLRRDGALVREVVVDGWSFEVEVEDLARAELRQRATRGVADDRAGGAVQVRAELPGRISSVGVAIGDEVQPGQPLLVIEAMKMLNDVRAPRGGVVQALSVDPGATVERGDLLVPLA